MLSTYLFGCLAFVSIYLPVYSYLTYPTIHLCICVFQCISLSMFTTFFYLCLSARLLVWETWVILSKCLSLFISISVYICLRVYLSIHPICMLYHSLMCFVRTISVSSCKCDSLLHKHIPVWFCIAFTEQVASPTVL